MSTIFQRPNQPYILFTTNVGPDNKPSLGIGSGINMEACYQNCIGVIPPEELLINFTKNGIIDNRYETPREYDHEILDIRKRDKDIYLVNYEKDKTEPNIIWHLPEYVRTFVFPEVMGITFIDDNLYIVKTSGDILAWKTPVTILDEKFGPRQKVTFHRDNELEKSYFTKNGGKYLFHKCIIRNREGKLVISSKLMDANGELECENLESVLGFAPLPDNYD